MNNYFNIGFINIFIFYIFLQMTHKINKLAFGDYFPGAVNPLDG